VEPEPKAKGSSAAGFYGLKILQVCVPIAIAVGYQPSQVNTSDFPGYFGVRPCPGQTMDAQITGYTGASVAYLETASRFNKTISISNFTVSSFPTAQGAENITFMMSIRSFGQPFAAGLSLNQSVARVFSGDPRLMTLPGNDTCSWYPSNQTATEGMTIAAFKDLPTGFVQVDAPALQLGGGILDLQLQFLSPHLWTHREEHRDRP